MVRTGFSPPGRIMALPDKNNKERAAQESSKSLSAHFRLVREAVNKVGGEEERLDSVLAYLDVSEDGVSPIPSPLFPGRSPRE